MSADPNGDLVRLAELLETAATEIRALAGELTPGDAEIYCAQLEKASVAFGEALALAEDLLTVWIPPMASA